MFDVRCSQPVRWAMMIFYHVDLNLPLASCRKLSQNILGKYDFDFSQHVTKHVTGHKIKICTRLDIWVLSSFIPAVKGAVRSLTMNT